MMPALERQCRNILDNITGDNFWDAYTWSLNESDDKVYDLCLQFILKDTDSVESALKSPTFLMIPRETLLDMLLFNQGTQKRVKRCFQEEQQEPREEAGEEEDDDDGEEKEEHGLLISEIELFQACDKWAEAECGRQELKSTGENKRCVLGDCLYLIGFSTMLLADLVNIVIPTGVLSVDEKCSLLEQAYGNPASKSLLKHQSSDQRFLLHVPNKWDAKIIIKSSQVQDNKKVKYSCVVIRARKRMALSRVWCVHHNIYGYKWKSREVMITDTKSGLAICRSITPEESEHREDPPHGFGLAYLDFKEVKLQANVKYKVEAEYSSAQDPSQTVGLSNRQWKISKTSFPTAATEPDVVSFSVPENTSNGHIVGFTVRFV